MFSSHSPTQGPLCEVTGMLIRLMVVIISQWTCGSPEIHTTYICPSHSSKAGKKKGGASA